MTHRETDNLQTPAAAATAHGETPTPDRLLESAVAFWRSAVLLSADELGLFAALASGPCDACALERRLELLPDATAGLLDALVALGLMERCGRQYRNTCEASRFLDPAQPTYIGPWLTMARATMREMADLTSRLRVAGATEQGHSSVADRMWADVAEILRSAGAPDDAQPT